MIWYVENSVRHRSERQAIEKLAGEVDWLELKDWRIDGGVRLNLDLVITVGDRTYEATLRYPNHFPHSPALVLPTNDKDRWSGHQWGAGGELCLDWGPDNWRLEITGAMMIESASRLLSGESVQDDGERGEVPSRHKMTTGQDLRGEYRRFLATAEYVAAAERLPMGVHAGALVSTWRNDERVYHPLSIGDGLASQHFPVPQSLLSDYVEKPFVTIKMNDEGLPPTGTLGGFKAVLALLGYTVPPETQYCIVWSQSGGIAGYFLNDAKDRVVSIAVIRVEPSLRRHDAIHGELASKTVAIVGCGSLGSKVAVSLARAGVPNFLLVDDDLMMSENLVRHDLDLADVGHHKVDVVARRILLVGGEHVQMRRHKIGGQESSGGVESLIEALSGCDLIVDCTSDTKAFTYLCAAVAVGRKPFIAAEVFAGGIGGRMMRSRPGLDPAPATCRAAIDAWCDERGRVAERGAINYGQREGEHPPLIASDADVTIIAGHATRFAIDLLARPGESVYPYSAYIMGFQDGWLFDAPFETWPIDLGPAEVATEESHELPQDIAQEEAALVQGLFQKFVENAAKGS